LNHKSLNKVYFHHDYRWKFVTVLQKLLTKYRCSNWFVWYVWLYSHLVGAGVFFGCWTRVKGIWAITEKRGICFLNPGFVFWLLVIFFVEINVQIIRKNKQLPIKFFNSSICKFFMKSSFFNDFSEVT
jgi:hypothetical protein